jgi:sodium/hydrogen antiporter
MVLCSIIIHGLSIPSFSLGRHASRTWSRHAPPDWTNLTRPIDRGTDVVINRDIDVEKGYTGKDQTPTPNETGTPNPNLNHDLAIPAFSEPEISTEQRNDPELLDGTEAPHGAPPEGDKIVQEWQGDGTVVERRAGPREEVSQTLGRTITSTNNLLCRLKLKSSATRQIENNLR